MKKRGSRANGKVKKSTNLIIFFHELWDGKLGESVIAQCIVYFTRHRQRFVQVNLYNGLVRSQFPASFSSFSGHDRQRGAGSGITGKIRRAR